MLLAISANDIAFVSVVVTGVTAIVGPLIGWSVAKAGHRHEREIDLSRRNYEARREVYVEMLAWIRLKFDAAKAFRAGDEVPEPLPDAETRSLFARVTAFGSIDVHVKIKEFDNAFSVAFEQIRKADSAELRKAVRLTAVQARVRELENLTRDELTR